MKYKGTVRDENGVLYETSFDLENDGVRLRLREMEPVEPESKPLSNRPFSMEPE